MEHTAESREREALYAQLQNEAASLDTIHEMLGSGKWTMDFDESGTMTRVNWSDEFRRMLGYRGQEDFPNVLESWSDLLHPDDKKRVLKEFNETIADYSGKRTYDGGPISNVFELFRGWTGYIWSFIDADNACEEVCFMSFFPLGVILSFIAVILKKKKDPWLISLGVANILLIVYSIVPLPHVIGALTLLNKSHNTRIITVIGFINLLILFRALCVLLGENLSNYRIKFVLISGISCILSFVVMEGSQSATVKVITLIMAALSGYLLSDINKLASKKGFIVYCYILALIGGVMVNPVSRGIQSVLEQPQLQEISKINEADEGIWMTVGTNMFGNVPTVMGADTASALDTYPDELLWTTIGLNEERDIWNRYAHKIIEIGNETSIELEQDDLITLYISVDDLRKLGVKYLFSIEDLSDFEGLECIYSYSYFDIYRVN